MHREVYCEVVTPLVDVDWHLLRARARDAATRSYAPYSRVRVGASALTSTGVVIDGSNVENASYGLTLCAECALVGDLVRVRGGRLVAVSVVAGDGEPLTPCGRCRQLLFEHGGAELLIDAGADAPPQRLGELLPGAFGPDDLETRASS
ncbi:MAG TPA: cytidine deaminase [Acidimicrobiales bacterium]|jgi:cytidine deaminase